MSGQMLDQAQQEEIDKDKPIELPCSVLLNQCLQVVTDARKKLQDQHQLVYDLQSQITQLKAAQATKEEEDALAKLCYLCLDAMKYPVDVCPSHHLACAECVAAQGVHFVWTMLINYTIQNEPFGVCYWNSERMANMACGLCKSKMHFQFPGAPISQLIDSCASRSCPTCGEKHPLEVLGLHIIQCKSQLVSCICCQLPVKIQDFAKHIREDCQRLQCRLCNLVTDAVTLRIHIKMHQTLSDMTTMMPTMLTQLLAEATTENTFFGVANVFLGLAQATEPNQFPQSPVVSTQERNQRQYPASVMPNIQTNFVQHFLTAQEDRKENGKVSPTQYQETQQSLQTDLQLVITRLREQKEEQQSSRRSSTRVAPQLRCLSPMPTPVYRRHRSRSPRPSYSPVPVRPTFSPVPVRPLLLPVDFQRPNWTQQCPLFLYGVCEAGDRCEFVHIFDD